MPKAPKSKVGQDKKVIHPNSRKASALARIASREQRVGKAKHATNLKLELLAEKLLWFQNHMDDEKKSYTKSELAKLCEEYLDRFNDELEQIQIVRGVGNRQGQQHTSRESAIKMTQEKEKHEFSEMGMEVPDLINGTNLKYFKKWDGEIRYLPNIKLKKVSLKDIKDDEKSETEEESAVPPDDDLDDNISEDSDKMADN